MSIIKNIYHTFERSNKKMLIQSSGSVPGEKMEKIRSGQAYLYQKNGMESEVIEIRFHKRVSGSFLTQALTMALKRYPYLNTKLVELDGDFYIVKNEMGLIAKSTKELAKLGHVSCGYHLIDVTYYGKLNDDIPILFMTARDDIASKQRGFRIGIDDYMVKPIDFDELFLRIGALLRRAKIAANRKLEVGNFVMDADEHTAYLNEEEISMTNREFSILYKLLSYPKKTFTRTQLMDEFWDADTETAPRAVDVYMTKLRQKLVDCTDFEIVTVHGLGYKAVIK